MYWNSSNRFLLPQPRALGSFKTTHTLNMCWLNWQFNNICSTKMSNKKLIVWMWSPESEFLLGKNCCWNCKIILSQLEHMNHSGSMKTTNWRTAILLQPTNNNWFKSLKISSSSPVCWSYNQQYFSKKQRITGQGYTVFRLKFSLKLLKNRRCNVYFKSIECL